MINMMNLKFNIEKQRLTRSNDNEYIVNNSHNYHTIDFNIMDNDWSGLEIFIILKNSDQEAYLIHYDNTPIILPYSVVKGSKFSISAYGVDNEQNRITTNELSIILEESGYTTDISEIPEEEMDIIADIYNKLTQKSNVGHDHTVSDISDFPTLSDVALSGEYTDLLNTPSIPVKITDLVNDSDFIETSATSGLIRNDGTVDSSVYVTDNDSRLSDARNPKPHTHTTNDITDFPEIPEDVSDLTDENNTPFTPKEHDHTVSDITDFPDIPIIPDIPSKTSDLTNDGDDGINSFIKNNDSRLSDTRNPKAHNQASSTITNNTAFDNILSGESTTLTLTDQDKINNAINNILGVIKGTKFIEITNDKGTASADTMGKLYIVNENSKVNVYYSVEDNGVYNWEKMDADILDELIINWSDIQNKPSTYTPSAHQHTKSEISDFPVLANVAVSGSYNDLSNKPSIPSKISDLTDDSDFISKSNTSGLVKNDGTIDTNTYLTQHQSLDDCVKKSNTAGLLKNDGTVDTTQYISQHQDINGKENTSNKVTSINANSTDTQYPSAKCVYDAINAMIGDVQDYINR